ncbi:MAG: zf-TFIIB domain-containing protein [Cyanobium sp.]
MNCPCCSAPLQGGGPVCSYCGSRLDLDLQGLSHLQPRGLNPLLHCPDCACALEALDLDGPEPLQLNRCPHCLGLFLPLGALERLVAREGRSALRIDHRLLAALSESPRAAATAWRYRRCPSCGELMLRTLHGRRSGVVVDHCRDHGLWLDAGELRQLLEWARAGGTLLDLQRRQEEAAEQARLQQRETEPNLRWLAEADTQASGRQRASLQGDAIGALLLRLARRLG